VCGRRRALSAHGFCTGGPAALRLPCSHGALAAIKSWVVDSFCAACSGAPLPLGRCRTRRGGCPRRSHREFAAAAAWALPPAPFLKMFSPRSGPCSGRAVSRASPVPFAFYRLRRLSTKLVMRARQCRMGIKRTLLWMAFVLHAWTAADTVVVSRPFSIPNSHKFDSSSSSWNVDDHADVQRAHGVVWIANAQSPCTNICNSHDCGCPKCFYCGLDCGCCCRTYTESEAIAWNNDHSCNNATQFRTSPSTALSFGNCSALTACITGTSYQSTPPTYTTNRVCTNVTHCRLGLTFQSRAPTYTTDRECNNTVTNCSLGTNYQSKTPTLTSDRECNHSITDCTLNGTWSLVPPTLTSNVRCNMTVSNCTVSVTYQTKAPTLTSDRNCTKVTQCHTNLTYQTALPTLTTDRNCTNFTQCNGSTPFQLRAPTYTTDRNCSQNWWAGCISGTTYATTNATATSNAVCTSVTNCTDIQISLVQPTPTTDRFCFTKCTLSQYIANAESRSASCQPISVGCPHGCHETQNAVPGISNRVCSCTSTLGTGQIAGIVVGCVVFFVLSGIAFVSIGRWLSTRDRQRVEEAEMQLLSAREESAASEATVRRIMSAWKIPAEHVTFLHKLAEGTYGAVWKGLWGSQTVAVKVLKRAVDDDEHGNEDFRKECEALQAIKHPNLIVFFGAGITDDDRPFMVSFHKPLTLCFVATIVMTLTREAAFAPSIAHLTGDRVHAGRVAPIGARGHPADDRLAGTSAYRAADC
jgi:hypothetical protein